jgi:hypothetical protein
MLIYLLNAYLPSYHRIDWISISISLILTESIPFALRSSSNWMQEIFHCAFALGFVLVNCFISKCDVSKGLTCIWLRKFVLWKSFLLLWEGCFLGNFLFPGEWEKHEVEVDWSQWNSFKISRSQRIYRYVEMFMLVCNWDFVVIIYVVAVNELC